MHYYSLRTTNGLKKWAFLLLFLALCRTGWCGEIKQITRAGNAVVTCFNENWAFCRYGLQPEGNRIEEPKGIEAPDWNDKSWKKLDVPHDFAIDGPFRMDLSGNTGRLPFQGIGWYRKTFKVDPSDSGKQIYIDFDGVMAYAKVWLNGHYVGTWPYGYNSFRLDLTPYIRFGGDNVIAVRTDTEQWDSRWYPGAGIYRNVWLVKTEPVHVDHWGTFLTTDTYADRSARVNLTVQIRNDKETDEAATVEAELFELDKNDRIGKKAGTLPVAHTAIRGKGIGCVALTGRVDRIKRWDIETPNRYVARITVSAGGKNDVYFTPFGFREIKVCRDSFLLNGKKLYIKGVCNHHDLGSLGAALNKSALERQLRIMQEMGCNSIRTSHNPPAPELLELADKMGFVVMDEAFDAWSRGKRQLDYNRLYNEWHEKDLEALVKRDRNHPSVIIWSIGNEVMEQRDVAMTRHLAEIVRRTDPTRPISNGYNDPNGGRESNAALALDIMGVNYFFGQQPKWDADPRYKDMPTMGTETSSCVSTRGCYFPDGERRKNFQINAYDMDHPGWGCTPDVQFRTNARFPRLLGEYVWTGFDYLGEPTPFNSDNTNLLNFRNDPSKQKELEAELEKLRRSQPPSRSSYFGIVDLAGFPKDRYYSYQAHWRPELPLAHIMPHWNWPDRIGKKVPVHVYTSGNEAELFVNGKSYGKKAKREGEDFRLVWDDVVYEPGTVRVVAYKNGKKWAEDSRETTGTAYALKASAEKSTISGTELAFIRIAVVDETGRIVPTASNKLTVRTEGNGELRTTDNGDPTSFVPFASPEKEAFNGLCLAIVGAKKGAHGTCTVHIEADGLKPAVLKLNIK